MIRLLFNAFSWQKNSLRRPTLKRIFIILVVVPSMLLHILITRFFLWLDTIFYSDFKQKNIDKAVFIVGVPRSGTSFLLNLLANNQQAFTAFRLWELVFAPSIIQKKFWLFISRIFPTKAIQNFIENLFFKRMKGIHDLGLGAFEEDEFFHQCFKSNKKIYLIENLYANHLDGSISNAGINYERFKKWHWEWSKCYFLNKHYNSFLIFLISMKNITKYSVKIIFFLFFNNYKYQLFKARLNGVIGFYLNTIFKKNKLNILRPQTN